MDRDKVTRIPQTAMATTRQKRAARGHDLHQLLIAGQALLDGGHAINAEMLAFWQSRLKAGLAVGGQLLECTSPESALEVQLDHAKAAMQAYVDQSARVTGLLMRALAAGFVPEPVAARSMAPARASAA